jgi:hypothetical protein
MEDNKKTLDWSAFRKAINDFCSNNPDNKDFVTTTFYRDSEARELYFIGSNGRGKQLTKAIYDEKADIRNKIVEELKDFYEQPGLPKALVDEIDQINESIRRLKVEAEKHFLRVATTREGLHLLAFVPFTKQEREITEKKFAMEEKSHDEDSGEEVA